MSRECENNESLLITRQEKKSSLLTFPTKAVVEILSTADKERDFSFAGNSGSASVALHSPSEGSVKMENFPVAFGGSLRTMGVWGRRLSGSRLAGHAAGGQGAEELCTRGSSSSALPSTSSDVCEKGVGADIPISPTQHFQTNKQIVPSEAFPSQSF